MPRTKPIVDFLKDVSPPDSSDESSEESLCMPKFVRKPKWGPMPRTSLGDLRLRRSVIERNFAPKEPPPLLSKNSTPIRTERKSFGQKTILGLSPIVLMNDVLNPPNETPNKTPNKSSNRTLAKRIFEDDPEQIEPPPPVTAVATCLVQVGAKRTSSSLDDSADQYYIPKKKIVADTIADEFADDSDNGTPQNKRQMKKRRHKSRAATLMDRTARRMTTVVQKVRDMGTEVTDSLIKRKRLPPPPKFVPKTDVQAKLVGSILAKTRSNNSESSLTSEVSSWREDVQKKHISIQCDHDTFIEDDQNEETITPDLRTNQQKQKTTGEEETQKYPKGKVNIISDHTIVPAQTSSTHGKAKASSSKTSRNSSKGVISTKDTHLVTALETSLEARQKQNLDAQMAFIRGLEHGRSFRLSKSAHAENEENVDCGDNDINNEHVSESMRLKEDSNRSKYAKNRSKLTNNTREDEKNARNRTDNEDQFMGAKTKHSGQKPGDQGKTIGSQATSFRDVDIPDNDDIGDFDSSTRQNCNAVKAKKTGRKERPEEGLRTGSDDSDCSHEVFEPTASPRRHKGHTSLHKSIQTQTGSQETVNASKTKKAPSKEGKKTGNKNNTRDAQPIVSDASDESDDEIDGRALTDKNKRLTSDDPKTIRNEPKNKETFDVSKTKRAAQKEAVKTGDKNKTRDARRNVSDDSDDGNEEVESRGSPKRQKGHASKGHKAIQYKTEHKEINTSHTKKAEPKGGQKTGDENNTRDARRNVSDDSDVGNEEVEIRGSPKKQKGHVSRGHKVIQTETANEETFNGSKTTKAAPKEGQKTGNKNNTRDAQPIVLDVSDESDEEIDGRASTDKKKQLTSNGPKTIRNETENKETFDASKTKRAVQKQGLKTGDKNNTRDARRNVSDDSDDGNEEVEIRGLPTKQKGHVSRGHKVIQTETGNEETFNASKTTKAAPKEGQKTGNKNNAKDARPTVSDDSDDNDEVFDIQPLPSRQKGHISKGHKAIQYEMEHKETFNTSKTKKAPPKKGPKTGDKNNTRDARRNVSDDSDDGNEEVEIRGSPKKQKGHASKGHKAIQYETEHKETFNTSHTKKAAAKGGHKTGDENNTRDARRSVSDGSDDGNEEVEIRGSPKKQKGHASKGHKAIQYETEHKETFNTSHTKKAAAKGGHKTGDENNTRDARRIVLDDSDDGNNELEIRGSRKKQKGHVSRGHKVIQTETANEETFNGSKTTKAAPKEGQKTGNKNNTRDAQPIVLDASDESDEEIDGRALTDKKKRLTSNGPKTIRNETENNETFDASKTKRAVQKQGLKTGDKNNTRDARRNVSDDSDDGNEEVEIRGSPKKQKGHASKGHKAIQYNTEHKEINTSHTKKAAPKGGQKTGDENNTRDARRIVLDDSDDGNDELEIRGSQKKQKGHVSRGHKVIQTETANEETFNGSKTTKAAPKEGQKTGNKNNTRDAQPIVLDASDESDEEIDGRALTDKKKRLTSNGPKTIRNETENNETFDASKTKRAVQKQGLKTGDKNNTRDARRNVSDDSDDGNEEVEIRGSPKKQKGHASKDHKAIQYETDHKETFNTSKTKRAAAKGGHKTGDENNTREARRNVSDHSDDDNEEVEIRGSPKKQKEHASRGHKAVQSETASEETFNASKTKKSAAKGRPKSGNKNHARNAVRTVSDYSDDSDEEFEVRATPSKQQGLKSVQHQPPNEEPVKGSRITKAGENTGDTEVLAAPKTKRGRPLKVHNHVQNETANKEVSKIKKTGPTDLFADQLSSRKKAKGTQIDTAEDQEYIFHDLANSDEVTEYRSSPTRQKGRPSKSHEAEFNDSKRKRIGPEGGAKTGHENRSRDALNASKEELRRSLFDGFLVPAIPVQKSSHKGKRKRTIDGRFNGNDLGSADEDGHRLTESRIVTTRSDDDDFTEDEGVSPPKQVKVSKKESFKHSKKDESLKSKRERPRKFAERVDGPKLVVSADDGYSSETTATVVGSVDVLPVRRTGRVRTATKFAATYTIYDSGTRLAREYGKIKYSAAPDENSRLSSTYSNIAPLMKPKTKKTTDRTPEEDEADPTEPPAVEKRGRKKKNATAAKDLRDETKAKRGRKLTKMSAVIEEDIEISCNDENVSIDANVVPPERSEVSGSAKKTREKSTKSSKATVVKGKKVAEKGVSKAKGRKKAGAERLEMDDARLPVEENRDPLPEVTIRRDASEEQMVHEDDNGTSIRHVATHDFCEAGPRRSDDGSRSSSSGSNDGEYAIEFPVNGAVVTINLCTSDELIWKKEGIMSTADGVFLRNTRTGYLNLGVGGHKTSKILRMSDMFLFVHKGTGKFTIHNKIIIKSAGQTIVVPFGARYSITNISDDEDLMLIYFTTKYELPQKQV